MAPTTESIVEASYEGFLSSETMMGSMLSDEEDYHNGSKMEFFGEEEEDIVFDAFGDAHALFPLSTVSALMHREKSYLPRDNFLVKLQNSALFDPSCRQRAVRWFFEMQDFFKFSFHTAALSINYFDRFISIYHMPSEKAWLVDLLSIACLSLAAKMEEIDVPLLVDLQVGVDNVFGPSIIQRMELLVLSTLEWRMRSVTAFSYTSYLLSRLQLSGNAERTLSPMINKLIISAIQDLRFLQFLPSSIAAVATLCAVQEKFPLHFSQKKRSLLCVWEPELHSEVANCYALMLEHFHTRCNIINSDDILRNSAPSKSYMSL